MWSMLERTAPSGRLWQKLEQLCWSATTWLVLTTSLAHDNILLGQPNRYISSNHMLWWQSIHGLLSIKRLPVLVLQTLFIWDMKQYFLWIVISQEDTTNISTECYRAEQQMNYLWGIPDICHFFYTGKIFGEWNLHRKTPIFCVKSVKNATFSRKICRKCQFFALNL